MSQGLYCSIFSKGRDESAQVYQEQFCACLDVGFCFPAFGQNEGKLKHLHVLSRDRDRD